MRTRGRLIFLLQINHDDISDFQDNYIRCHWHSEPEISIVTEGKVLYLAEGNLSVWIPGTD